MAELTVSVSRAISKVSRPDAVTTPMFDNEAVFNGREPL